MLGDEMLTCRYAFFSLSVSSYFSCYKFILIVLNCSKSLCIFHLSSNKTMVRDLEKS